MRIAVLGTGMVGQAIGRRLVELGHEVKMGSRTADNEKAVGFAKEAGGGASNGTFADAAAFGEWVFNCTNGGATMDVLEAAGADNLKGKILLDVSNPLDFSKGFPPTLFVSNDDSLGERIQRAYPDTKVVKTLNTMNCYIMVDPSRVPGDHDVFVSGDDPDAKEQVAGFLRSQFGWKSPIDLGDITTARGTEAWLLLWTRLYAAFDSPEFNMKLVRQG